MRITGDQKMRDARRLRGSGLSWVDLTRNYGFGLRFFSGAPASAIEAGTAASTKIDAVHESAIPKGDAHA
jgi:hypothetical protein